MLDEAHLLCDLDHPNIAKIRDLEFDGNGFPILVLEYVRGRSLHQLLKEGKVSIERAAGWLAGAADAVGYAHRRGVLHLDLKPGNIVIDENDKAKVIDFGLARMRDAWSDSASESDGIRGTPDYMAPEQAEGVAEKVTARSDDFALGAILYRVLTGSAPFEAKTPQQALLRSQRYDVDLDALKNAAASSPLIDTCRRAISRDPSERFEQTEDFAKMLQATMHEPAPDLEIPQLADINPLLKPFWRHLDDDLRQILVVAATLAQLEGKNYLSTTNFVKALMVLKPGRISDFFSELPDGALPESIPEDIPLQLSALQSLGSFSPCINSAISNLTPEVSFEEKLSSEDVYIDIARYATGKSTQRLRSHGVSKPDVENIVTQLGWHLVERSTAITE